MAEYFEGCKDINNCELRSSNGKTCLTCIIYEQWIPIHHEIIRCGATLECKLKRLLGVRLEEKKTFEEKLNTTIGPKAIGNIHSAISQNSIFSSVMEDYIEVERNLLYESPICGKYIIDQYQLCRTVRVFGSTKRFLWKSSEWDISLSEYLNFYYDASDSYEFDEKCKCDTPKKQKKKDGNFVVDLGILSFKVPFFHLSIEEGFKIQFYDGEQIYPQSLIRGGDIELNAKWLSHYQQEILGFPDNMLKAKIIPFDLLEKYPEIISPATINI